MKSSTIKTSAIRVQFTLYIIIYSVCKVRIWVLNISTCEGKSHLVLVNEENNNLATIVMNIFLKHNFSSVDTWRRIKYSVYWD